MKFVSIDIETTGLDPERNHVLEFAAVAVDYEKAPVVTSTRDTITIGPKHIRDVFHCYIENKFTTWDGYCLSMHSDLIKRMKDPGGVVTISAEQLYDTFAEWMLVHHKDFFFYDKLLAAGKNFSTFDLLFLKQMDKCFGRLFHKRVLDPAILFCRSSDQNTPDLTECCKRAGVEFDLKHDAVADATAVANLLVKHFERE